MEAPDRFYVRWLDGYMRGFGMSVRTEDSDIEYIRADLHQAEVDALHGKCDRLTALVGHKDHCLWEHTCEDGWWTDCGCVVAIEYNGPMDKGFKFCPYCGGEIWMGEGE